jgi:hypothetical protein
MCRIFLLFRPGEPAARRSGIMALREVGNRGNGLRTSCSLWAQLLHVGNFPHVALVLRRVAR